MDANDCEFVDGFHGGEVVFARILARMAEDAGNGLAPFVNMERLRLAARTHAGEMLVDTRFRRAGDREADFLNLDRDKI